MLLQLCEIIMLIRDHVAFSQFVCFMITALKISRYQDTLKRGHMEFSQFMCFMITALKISR